MAYIDKQLALDAIKAYCGEPWVTVRFRDCIHWGKRFYDDIETCFEHRNVDGSEQETGPEDFCSWAKERRNDG